MKRRGSREHAGRTPWVKHTGTKQFVERGNLPGVTSAGTPGEHVWIVLTVHRVDGAAAWAGEDIHLDNENLMDISPPTCFRCQEYYTPEVDELPCAGWTS